MAETDYKTQGELVGLNRKAYNQNIQQLDTQNNEIFINDTKQVINAIK